LIVDSEWPIENEKSQIVNLLSAVEGKIRIFLSLWQFEKTKPIAGRRDVSSLERYSYGSDPAAGYGRTNPIFSVLGSAVRSLKKQTQIT
jgi:hypothetical protein